MVNALMKNQRIFFMQYGQKKISEHVQKHTKLK